MPEYADRLYVCARRRNDDDGMRTNFLDERGDWLRAEDFGRAIRFTNTDQAWELIADKGRNWDAWGGWAVNVVLEEVAQKMAVEQAMVGDPEPEVD